jgi:hypothetical protein
VQDFDMLMADGTLKSFSRGIQPDFDHYLINFGAIGIVTEMSIRLVAPFNVNKQIFENLDWDSLAHNFEAITSGQDYLSFFSKFTERKMNSVWVGRAYTDTPPTDVHSFYGAPHIKSERVHPVGPE